LISLSKQAISSVKWTTLQTAVVGLIGPIILLIKAKFLSPEEFGYISIVLIVIGFFQLFENFGISQAIIQKDEITSQESSTLFYFNILMCFALAGILYVSAPFFSVFFSLPDLTIYLRIVCVIVLLNGPSLLYRAFLEKQMYFKHLSLIAIMGNLIDLGTTTYFLMMGLGVKAIIYAHIVKVMFSTLLIIALNVRFKTTKIMIYFNPIKLLPFLRFGVFVSAKQIMTFMAHRLDEVIIGYFLAPEVLGVYHFGKSMLEKFRGLITSSFAKVLFPVMSKLKNNPQKLSFAYQRISEYIAFGSFPIFAGIAVTAHLFVPVIFGEKWLDSIIVFQVFSVALICLVLTANISTSLLYAVNKPDMVFYIDIVTNLIYFSTLLFFAPQGMVAVLITYSCYVIYKTLVLQYYTNRQLVDSFLSYFQKMIMPALFTLIMIITVLSFQLLTQSILGIEMQLSGSIFFGALIYIILSCVFAPEVLIQIRLAIQKGEIAG
jgi:O-antigen/teichoic acid export membrane protein